MSRFLHLLFVICILQNYVNSQRWPGSYAPNMAHEEFFPHKEQATLPFPTNPGEFWVEALKAVYGPAHVLFGISLWPNITAENADCIIKGPIAGALITQIGVGISKPNKIQVLLHVADLLMFNYDGSIVLELDRDRVAEDGALVSLDVTKVLNNFKEMMNPANWAKLKAEFYQDSKAFFVKHLEVFYPAEVTFNFNVKGLLGIKNVLSKENRLTNNIVVSLSAGSVKQFPPKQFGFVLQNPIKLKNSKSEIAGTIHKLTTVFAHVLNDERLCQTIVNSKLTESIIRDHVSKIVDLR